MKDGTLMVRRSSEGGPVMAQAGRAAAESRWAIRLRQIRNDLETITDRAEAEFLSIGTLFQDFYSRAKRISEMSSDVAGRMTGMEIVEAIDGLNALMARMESYLKRSEAETHQRTERLTEVLHFMEGVGQPLGDFHRITKHLRSLSVTGMVQNALLVSKSSSFGHLLNDVRELSVVMSEKAGTIEKKMVLLERLIEDTIKGFREFEEQQLKKARSILDHTMNVLCSISGRYGTSKTAAVDIANRSEAISRSTGDIVTSVQFHDITRQQFEHIGHALERTSEYAQPDPERRLLAGSGNDGAVTGGTADFCCSQAAQLVRVRDTFVTAVNEVVGNLSQIASTISDMAVDTEKIVGTGEPGNESFLTGMEATLSSVRASFRALSENAAARKRLSEAVLTITKTTAEMSGHIVDIEEIAEDVELIAINAEIKSSQLGREGAAFVVVAGSIQRLSSETCGQVQKVSEVLRLITSASGELVESIDAELDISVREIHDISSDLEKLMQTLSGLDRSILKIFREIDEADRRLSEDISRFVKDIEVHHMVGRVVDAAIAGLEALSSDARLIFPEGPMTGGRHEGHFPDPERRGGEGSVEFF